MAKHCVQDRVRYVQGCQGEDLTKQSFADECDINLIMARFERTGMFTHANAQEPRYEDLPSMDYHAAMNAVVQAQEAFMALPAQLRARFSNDPGALLDFVADPANRKEAEDLGLVARAPVVKEPEKASEKVSEKVSEKAPEKAP